MSDITYKKFSELTRVDSLQTSDIIPIAQFVSGTNYNSRSIPLSTLYNQTSGALITPFTTSIQTTINSALSSDKWNSTYSTVQTNSATWGTVTGGLTIFKEISSTSSPNSSVTVHALSVQSSVANVDITLAAKGTGATLAQIPDSGNPGGNKRGSYATDWQKVRVSPSQVASGLRSVIGGGTNNTAGGTDSTVAGGISNAASNNYSTIAGGSNNTTSGIGATIGGGEGNAASGEDAVVAGGSVNTASGDYSTIGGGQSNDASGYYSTIGGGYNNTASNDYSTVVGGEDNIASGWKSNIVGGFDNKSTGAYSACLNGYRNIASGDWSVCMGESNSANGNYSTAIGYGVSATNYGEFAYNTSVFTTFGDNKSSTMLLKTTTSGLVSAQCYLNGSSEEITMPANSTYAYTTTIVGLSSHANSSGLHFILRGFAKCNGTGTVTVYPATSDLTQRVPTTLNATMSAAGDKLRVVVYSPGSTYYWHAKVQGEFLQF